MQTHCSADERRVIYCWQSRWPVFAPGLMSPFFSASSIMFLPILSLTLRQGSWISNLQAIRAPAPLLTLFRNTIGVLPIKSVTLFAILAPSVAGDLAGETSIATALTCASDLQTKGARLTGACLRLCCRKGFATVLRFTYVHMQVPCNDID